MKLAYLLLALLIAVTNAYAQQQGASKADFSHLKPGSSITLKADFIVPRLSYLSNDFVNGTNGNGGCFFEVSEFETFDRLIKRGRTFQIESVSTVEEFAVTARYRYTMKLKTEKTKSLNWICISPMHEYVGPQTRFSYRPMTVEHFNKTFGDQIELTPVISSPELDQIEIY